jgi:hypothetical protein
LERSGHSNPTHPLSREHGTAHWTASRSRLVRSRFVCRTHGPKAGAAERVPADRYPHIFRFAWKGEWLRGENKRLSLYEIFVPTFWKQNYDDGAFFKDKVVLIGPEGNYTKDIASTPLAWSPGLNFISMR